MDSLDDNLISSTTELTETAKAYLKESAKWGRFLSILGFILIAFMSIAAFSVGTIFSQFNDLISNSGQVNQFPMQAFASTFTILYLLLAIFYFFPTFYLYQFSSKMIKGIDSGSQTLLIDSFKNLKSMFKFWGVFSIVVLSIYGLVLLIALLNFLI